MSLLAELEAHGERIAAAGRRVREVDIEVRGAAEAVAAAREQLIEGHAGEVEPAELSKLSRTLTVAEDNARRLSEERAAGAKRALGRAEADRATFVGASYEGILRERRPHAERVAAAVEDALGELAAAIAGWHAEEAAAAGIMRLAGRGGDRIAVLPGGLVDLSRDARRLGAPDIPPPGPTI